MDTEVKGQVPTYSCDDPTDRSSVRADSLDNSKSRVLMDLMTRPVTLAGVPKFVLACVAFAAICNVITLIPSFLGGSPCRNTGSHELSQVGGIRRQSAILHNNTSTLPQPSPRESHFHNVLESLASRNRQEQFDKIFQTNQWGYVQ